MNMSTLSNTAAYEAAIIEKLARIRAGAQPRVVDLFSGCGGISLGAQKAGCRVAGAIEVDPTAAKSHALNFHSGDALHGVARDISRQDPATFLNEINGVDGHLFDSVDILVGGPPCQSFARIGRAKLREVANHPEAFLSDPRSGLYRDYIRFIEALRPVAVVIENVPDVLNFGGLNIFEVIAQSLSEDYDCVYGLMNSSHFGVPQMRTRCFLIGVARPCGISPALPSPSNHHVLPSGYKGTRDVALRYIDDLVGESHYAETPAASPLVPPAVTAEQAIGDLPELFALDLQKRGKLKKGRQDLTASIQLPSDQVVSEYAKTIRTWPGYESDGLVRGHVFRYLPRDYKIFARLKPGDQYPAAHMLANKMFRERLRREPNPITEGDPEYKRLLAEFVPPYDPGKFPNKWRKMEADQPARTLTAHIGKDTYSHIHYDSKQARTITVREAARLQSFPDGFRFSGAMNAAFKQIGNAVPPLLAYSVLQQLLQSLGQPSQQVSHL